MTRAEADAANVVLRWTFNRKPLVEPDELLGALLLLAGGANRRLGEGVTPDEVRKWARIHA
jgi:hypothetical protein